MKVVRSSNGIFPWKQIFEKGCRYNKMKNGVQEQCQQIDNQFFKEIPFSQNDLTDNGCTCENEIDYSNYVPININKIDHSNIMDIFWGILHHIFYYSDKKLNTKEVEFHFSGARNRQNYEYLKKKNNYSYIDFNVLNIFDFENINTNFIVDCSMDAFFGVTFKRIKIKPISYSIRSGKMNQFSKSHLVSFIFEAYDEDYKTWIVLDERANMNELIPAGGFNMFYVRTCNKYFSSFRIRQTDVGCNGFWGFAISAFDIHGNIIEIPSCDSFDHKIDEKIDLFDIHPTIDLNDYLF